MIFVLFLFSIFTLQSTELNSIEKLQHKFENISNLEADFIQSSNGKNLMSGKFYFSQKNNYRIELKNNTIISDGNSIWNEDKKRNKVIISNINDDPLAFSLREYIYEYPKYCKISEEKVTEGTIMSFTPKNSDLNFKLAKLWIGTENLINKIEVFDFGGNSFLFEFRKIQINKSFNMGLFTFKDNGKLKIIDLR